MTAALGASLLALSLAGCDAGTDAPAAPEAERAEAPPSIVLITLDTVRRDALGAYGQPRPSSPEIDRLAREGTLFEHCVSSSPSTLPSHASILTGLQPYAHGARSNPGYALAMEHVTLAEVLRARGYATAAEVATDVIARHSQLQQGFDSYRDPSSPGAKRHPMTVSDEGGTRTIDLPERDAADVTSHGLAFLREHRDRPFFLWLHYYDAHREWIPPAAFLEEIPDSPYHAEIRYADHHVGLVRAEIERLGLRNRVVLAVTSDHGEGLGEHGEQTHSYFVYDSTMAVPLLLWGPGRIPAGRRVEPLVRTIDLAPTLLDLAGAPIPAAVQGVSLRGLIEGGPAGPDRLGYGESIDLHVAFGSAVLRFVRRGNWKYIHKVNPELYDLAKDPGETRNRAAAEPERTRALRAELEQLLAQAPAPAGDAAIAIDDETLDRLAALGYAATGAAPDRNALASLDLVGPDPDTLIGDIEEISQGWAAVRAGRNDEAAKTFARLRVTHPESMRVIDGQVNALMRAGRYDEARPVLRRALELAPDDLRYYGAYAAANLTLGDAGEAERVLRAATEVDDCAREARLMLGALLGAQGRANEQVAVLVRGLDVCADPGPFWNDAAYALATVEDPALRDASRALALARKAVAGHPEDPAPHDTLAVAQAALGDFSAARDTARQALRLLAAQEAPDDAIAPYRAHLAAFEAERVVAQGE